MPIKYYGTEGPTIVIKSKDELYEALDLLHTQVIDNLGDESPCLEVLEAAMENLENLEE